MWNKNQNTNSSFFFSLHYYVCTCVYMHILYIPLVSDVYAVVCGKGVPSLLASQCSVFLRFLFFFLFYVNCFFSFFFQIDSKYQKTAPRIFFSIQSNSIEIHALLKFKNSFRGCFIEMERIFYVFLPKYIEIVLMCTCFNCIKFVLFSFFSVTNHF